MKPRLPVVLLSLLTGVLPACQARDRSVQEPVALNHATPEGNVRWLYHPESKAPPTGRLRLSDAGLSKEGGLSEEGHQLEVDEAGSRWMLQPGKLPRPSAFGAPEPLVALAQEGQGFSALGKSGAVYFFEEPLGPFVSVRTPAQPFVQARRVGSSLVGLDSAGKIFRSDDQGRSWSPLKHEGFFAGLASAGKSELIGYTIPEQWFRSADGGRHFERLNFDSVAPRSIENLLDGRVIIDGLLETYLYEAGRLEVGEAPTVSTEGYALPKYGGARAVDQHHAVFAGSEYIELTRSAGKSEWTVARGRWQEPLVEFLTPGPGFCSQFQIAAAGQQLILACAGGTTVEVAPPFKLFRFISPAKGFVQLGPTLRGEMKSLGIAVSKSGQVAMVGACPPHSTEPGCSVEAVTLVEADGTAKSISVPGLGQPSAVAFTPSGDLWAAGVRLKDRHSLLIGPWRRFDDIPEIVDLSRIAAFPEADPTPFTILPGGDGLLTASRVIGGTHYLATFSKQRQFLGRGSAPAGSGRLHGAGKYIAALKAEDSLLWESTSGGISWTKSELPRSVCEGGASCDPGLVCGDEGCLVGDELTRIGWGVDKNVTPSRVAELGEEAAAQGTATGLVCQPTASGWQDLPGVHRIPDASSAAQGDALWSDIESFPHQAAANAIRANFGAESLQRETLLAPVPSAENYAFATFPQVEGGAVVRFKKPPSHLSTFQTTIEVAWDNRFENLIGQGSISGDWGRRPMHFEPGSELSDVARPEYVGVAGDGLYLKLGDENSTNEGSYFFQGSGKSGRVEQIFDKAWPHEVAPLSGWFSRSRALSTARVERIHPYGRAGALLLIAGSRVVVRSGETSGSSPALPFTPYLLSSLTDESSTFAEGVHVAYRGTQIGFLALQIDNLRGQHRAYFVGLGETEAFEPPLAVPLLSDLADVPRACTKQDRQSTPRVIVPAFLGPRRSVRVLGLAGDALEMDTRRAVLFGSKEQPCVSAFEAVRQREIDEKAQYAALIAPGAGVISWVFRAETLPQGEQISARPMRCEFQAIGASGVPEMRVEK